MPWKNPWFPCTSSADTDPRLLAQARIDAPSRMQARRAQSAGSWMVMFVLKATRWGPRSIAKLVQITPIAMVYGRYIYGLSIFTMVYKPTYNWGGTTLYGSNGIPHDWRNLQLKKISIIWDFHVTIEELWNILILKVRHSIEMELHHHW